MGQAGVGVARSGGARSWGGKDVLLGEGVPQVLLSLGVSIDG